MGGRRLWRFASPSGDEPGRCRCRRAPAPAAASAPGSPCFDQSLPGSGAGTFQLCKGGLQIWGAQTKPGAAPSPILQVLSLALVLDSALLVPQDPNFKKKPWCRESHGVTRLHWCNSIISHPSVMVSKDQIFPRPDHHTQQLPFPKSRGLC